MEIFTKYRIGKLPEAGLIVENWDLAIAPPGFLSLPISLEHARRAGNLDIPHKDPFDRILIAQAQIENVPLLSNEKLFDSFGVERIW